jgi:hypothetical protein
MKRAVHPRNAEEQREGGAMTGTVAVQVAAGVLAAAVLGIIVYRRKQKSA